jgi:hypothetical protein
VPHTALLLIHLLLAAPNQSASDCADAASCRTAALEAAARKDFELFHDLAWRAAQKGKPNDPAAMYLLARAQSLSGRPGDALVMLRRLAQMGVATDARENEAFSRVRALSGWPELDAIIVSGDPPAPAPPPLPAGGGRATSPGAVTAAPARGAAPSRPPPAPAPRAEPPSAAPPAPPAASPGAARTAAPAAEDALGLADDALQPVGIAYDGASRRFVIGDRGANKLIVADEVFNHVNDLIGAASGGFETLAGLDIDARRGDLWVASSNGSGGAFVHKLQLVSGRLLATIEVPSALGAARFSDVSMTESGGLLLVDASGGRLLTFRSGAGEFERAVALELPAPTSVAPAGPIAYVSHASGLAMIDLASGRTSDVGAADGVDVAGLQRIRWSRGTIIGIRRDAGTGAATLVRIRLARKGTLASAIEPLDTGATSTGPALTIWRDAAYYVAKRAGAVAIRRVPLQ